MRPSLAFLLWISAAIALSGLMLLHASRQEQARREMLERMKTMVREYGLTDLCLVTEARYTRHPSMADFHSAFQDHPCALDIFPSGSVIPVPPHLRTRPGARDRSSLGAPLGPPEHRGD